MPSSTSTRSSPRTRPRAAGRPRGDRADGRSRPEPFGRPADPGQLDPGRLGGHGAPRRRRREPRNGCGGPVVLHEVGDRPVERRRQLEQGRDRREPCRRARPCGSRRPTPRRAGRAAGARTRAADGDHGPSGRSHRRSASTPRRPTGGGCPTGRWSSGLLDSVIANSILNRRHVWWTIARSSPRTPAATTGRGFVVPRKTVIIGGGAAGLGLRGRGQGGRPRTPMSSSTPSTRTSPTARAASPTCTAGRSRTSSGCSCAGKQAYVDAGIDVHYETEVTSIDTAAKTVTVDGRGRRSRYDDADHRHRVRLRRPRRPGRGPRRPVLRQEHPQGDGVGQGHLRDEDAPWSSRPARSAWRWSTALAHRGVETHLVDPQPVRRWR